MTKETDIYKMPAVSKLPGKARAATLKKRVADANKYRVDHNPLRGLTLARAVSMFESAQRGEVSDLMWLYDFIERTDAVPFALVDRRTSPLMEMDFNCKAVRQEDRGTDYDENLAKDQAAYLRTVYEKIDNLYEAIEHLELAAFRSFAHAQKHFDSNGHIVHLECLDQWNFLRDGMYGDWFWNPTARQTTARNLGEDNRLDPRYFVIREQRRHIDRIAAIKYIRKNLGEKDWASFVEIFGLNGAYIIGPPNVPEGKEQEYADAGEAAAAGGSGYLPNGSSVEFANAQRGAMPFERYIKYLDEQLVLAGTGGKLTMLAESGSGTLAGNAHEDTFMQIARMEARRISEVFQRAIDIPHLNRKFPDRPILAYFELAANEEQDVGEIIEHNAKLYSGGYAIEQGALEEKTGYKLSELSKPGTTSAEVADPSGSSHPPHDDQRLNNTATSASSLQIRNKADAEELFASVRQDLLPAAQSQFDGLVKELLALVESEVPVDDKLATLSGIRERLPELLDGNQDPALAEAMQQVMAASWANGVAEGAEEVAS